MNRLIAFVRRVIAKEPLVVTGLAGGAGLLLSLHYGTNANGDLQGTSAIALAAVVSFLSRFVGPTNGKLIAGWAAKQIAELVATHQETLEATVNDGVQDLKRAAAGLARPSGVPQLIPPAATVPVAAGAVSASPASAPVEHADPFVQLAELVG